jgi:C-terminal processing protease CtpA/Prc
MRGAVALLFAAAVAVAGEKELRRDDGEQKSQRSSAGTGHVVSFDAPRGTWWVRSVVIYGKRYGGGYEPAETTFTVTICDGDLKPLAATTAKYELFPAGRFEWVEVPLGEPLEAPATMKVVVEFRPTATKGVYVGHDGSKASHSAYGSPGGSEKPFEHEWMIRARLSSSKPKPPKEKKPDPRLYAADFDFLAKTVRARFPALAKKGIDWEAACREWRPRFRAARSDREHVLNAMELLALLRDSHTGVTDSKVEAPAFEGLYGAGLWIAADQGRLLLRAAVPGHPLLERVKPGAELLTVGGKPARLVHLAVRAQVKRWHGWSSDHFLDARLSFQFFPFGKDERVSATFLDPSGTVVTTELERWGPGGRGLSRAAVTMPEGLAAEGLAVSQRLDERTGYIRILGSMDEKTREAFDTAFDGLKGVDGILLDCRGMGGGSDRPAWAMAGRFFDKRVAEPPVEPTGAWQFAGPVVLLQDERMISSAETFTWAMTETGRVLSVGRPTGGATIIPDGFDAPSGLFRFRLGVHDRKTPIQGVQPEGIGTPPDILVRYEPALLAKHGDPVLGVAREALDLLRRGENRGAVVARLLDSPTAEALEWQIRLLAEPRNPMPDFVEGCRWLEEAAEVADRDLAARARAAFAMWSHEADAQRACEELLSRRFPPDRAGAAAFLESRKGSRWAEALAAYLR